MRLGVSGKIFLAYTALVTVFLGSSALALVYMNRARERVVASQMLFDVQASLDDAWRGLGSAPATVARKPDPRRSLAFGNAQGKLKEALATLEGYRSAQGSGRRWWSPALAPPLALDGHVRTISELRDRLAGAAAGLAAYEASESEEERRRFVIELTELTYQLDREKRVIRGESRRIAARLRADEEAARNLALGIGALGLLVALLVAASMLRTLRPLRLLRERARAVASGDYARRIDVHSQDEIGELAREFDAMAAAIEERERRLIRSEQLATIGRMASQITHEIRNPLASIGLNAELLADHLSPEHEEARRLLSAIAREIDRLGEITEGYLRFVRLPRGERAPEALGVVLSRTLDFARAELQQAGIEVEVELDPDLPETLADEGQVRQALLNLIRNAREAMSSGGRLRAWARRAPGGAVELGLQDSGPGIAPADLARIFDPFFTTKRSGTGLGLALVSQIMTDHGGKVVVEAAPGGGTVFRLLFPAPPEAPAGAAARAPVAAEGLAAMGRPA